MSVAVSPPTPPLAISTLRRSWNWLGWSLLAFAIVATLTLLFWLHTRQVFNLTMVDRTSKARVRTARRVDGDLELLTGDVQILCRQIQLGTLSTSALFQQSMKMLRASIPGIRDAAWVAADGHIISGNTAATQMPASNLVQWLAQLRSAPGGRFVPLQSANAASSNAGIRVFACPVIDQSGTVNGAIFVCLSFNELIDAALPGNNIFGRSLRVEDREGRVVMTDGDQSLFSAKRMPASDVVHVLDESLNIFMSYQGPSSVLQPLEESPGFVIVGLLLAILAGALVGYMTRNRSVMHQTTQAHLDALEALHHVAAMIGIHARPPGEVMEQLVNSTCKVFGIPKAFVCQIEPNEMIRLIYHTGFDDTPPDWTVRRLNETRGIERCIKSREPIYVADVVRNPDQVVDVNRLLKYNIRSVLMLPIEAGPELIGVMVLGDRVPRVFTEQERRLARLWASQCAVTLVNQQLAAASDEALKRQQQLTDQIQRDAQTKEILLREMNHRVKNNMAGIVGLLSAGAPDLSEPARRWLDRAIGRIQTLARAHELFVGFSEEVSLNDLIEQTLKPIHAMMPPSARLVVAGDVTHTLATDKAVTLAMVLNELASNALEHGIGPDGTLAVRIERVRAHTIRIEVSDDGSAQPLAGTNTEISESGGGMGLNLVRGLVGRELRGRFDMGHRDGGTVAIIEFPTSDASQISETSPETHAEGKHYAGWKQQTAVSINN